MTTPKPAIIPGTVEDPTGADALERRAIDDFNRRMRKIGKAYLAGLDRIPSAPVVNKKYEYRIDQTLLNSTLAQMGAEVDRVLLEGGPTDVWFFREYVQTANKRGTAQQFANLSQQSPVYHAGRGSLAEIIQTEPYRRRLGLLAAREFEEMVGLSGNVKANMARVLTDGLARGLNPREIAKNLTAQTGIEAGRAARIARTEITTALRRARWDESDEAAELYNLDTKEMHLSALSATTRASHAARHGNLYTREQVRDWWAEGANGINCKCSTTTMMVDSEGKPLVSSTVERAKATKKKMETRGYDWSE